MQRFGHSEMKRDTSMHPGWIFTIWRTLGDHPVTAHEVVLLLSVKICFVSKIQKIIKFSPLIAEEAENHCSICTVHYHAVERIM